MTILLKVYTDSKGEILTLKQLGERQIRKLLPYFTGMTYISTKQ